MGIRDETQKIIFKKEGGGRRRRRARERERERRESKKGEKV
jgi:hypothetical protein